MAVCEHGSMGVCTYENLNSWAYVSMCRINCAPVADCVYVWIIAFRKVLVFSRSVIFFPRH